MERFKDQVAIVTGGATGLGYAIARRLGNEGARVMIFDANGERAEAAAAELGAEAKQVDVADEGSVREAIAAVQREVGPPDVMINSAGVAGPTNTPIVNYSSADFDRTCAINLRGSFLMTKYAIAPMLERNYGRILLIASIAGKEGNPGMCGYSATKAGVIGLVKGVGKEYATSGVTVNGLAPAVIMTDLVRDLAPETVSYMTAKIPMQRCGSLEEVAAMAAWIVSRECSFTTGFTFDLSGGRATY
ncbi:MAG TPA: SDR family NAD(P)-dependent oxidoreductase [Bryobacteraceae bacterium]|nr:SDR family NAD(P)-dependent oxidoreductase [Bryobacteraceae bacterium]